MKGEHPFGGAPPSCHDYRLILVYQSLVVTQSKFFKKMNFKHAKITGVFKKVFDKVIL